MRAAGELLTITREVDPELEIAAIADRPSRAGPAGNKALLFTNVKDSRFPVLIRSATFPPGTMGRHLALSPDGNALVFIDTVGGLQLWMKEEDRAEAVALTGTAQGNTPRFSPDGEWVAFMADNKLKKVPRVGGSAVTLGDSAGSSIAWLDDGTLLYRGTQAGSPALRAFEMDSSRRGMPENQKAGIGGSQWVPRRETGFVLWFPRSPDDRVVLRPTAPVRFGGQGEPCLASLTGTAEPGRSLEHRQVRNRGGPPEVVASDWIASVPVSREF